MPNKEQKKRPTLVVNLLNTFNAKELNGFADFLTCHYFNTDKLVIQLLKALQKYVIQQHFFDAVLQCRVYKFVFKKQAAAKDSLSKAQKTELNRKLSLLLRLAEEFIAINNLRENKYAAIDYLYPELLKRKQHSLYKRHFKKIEFELETHVERDASYYDNLAKLYESQLAYLNTTQELENNKNFENCILAIDLSFLLKRLSIHQTILSLNRYSSKNINTKLYEPIVTLLEMPDYKNNTLVRLNKTSIALIENMDVLSFENVLKFIETESRNISDADLSSLYFNALNFCSSQIRKGNFEFYKRSFDIYLDMHLKGLLLKDKFLHSSVYSSIITAGCRAKQIDWAKKLLKYYKPHLKTNIKNSIYNYNKGLITFFQKKYNEAHSHFILTNKTNTTIDFNARLYILQCLYETKKDYNFQFVQSLRSTKEFFKNHKKLPNQRKKAYENFLQILLKLYSIFYKKRKTSIKIIEEQLLNMEVVSFRAWLLEKINEHKERTN